MTSRSRLLARHAVFVGRLISESHERLTDLANSRNTALPRCVTRTAFLQLLHHAIEIGIAGAKAPCEPVPAALGNLLAVSDHLELTGFPRSRDGFNVKAPLDEGHETRDLGLVVLSRRAVNDLDLHSVLQSASCSELVYSA
jgi:hypothetical protein